MSVYCPFLKLFLDEEILPVLFSILPLVLRKGLVHRVLGKNVDFEARTPSCKSHLNILKLKHLSAVCGLGHVFHN